MAKPVIRRKIVPENPVKVGARFGRLLILEDGWEQVSQAGYCADMVKVRCDCGTEKFIRARSLWPRGIKSCGCLQKEIAANIARSRRTHGDAGGVRAPEYNVYRTMLSRCYNPKVNKYADYGGRGIVVCDRWRGDHGYQNFLEDMGRRPAGCSIEREDGNGPYSPENCRWATATEQANNRRSSRFLVFQGRRRTLSQWCRELGLNPATVHDRIDRGWSIDKALSTPVI